MIGISGALIRSRNLMELIFNPCGEFGWSPEGQSPPLWARRQHARLSCSGPGFDPLSGQVSWVRFFRGFSSPVRQMSGSFRPLNSPNIIWPSLSSSLIIPYGRQWPEMLTRPKNLKYPSIRRAKLAKSTLLTSTVVSQGSFKVCSDAKERLGCGKQPHLFIPGKSAALVPEFAAEDLSSAELQLWFLCLQWRTCSWAWHSNDDLGQNLGPGIVVIFLTLFVLHQLDPPWFGSKDIILQKGCFGHQ